MPPGSFHISARKDALDFEMTHGFLGDHAHLSRGIPRETFRNRPDNYAIVPCTTANGRRVAALPLKYGV